MGLARFVMGRLLLGVVTVFVVTVVVFALTHALGDPATAVLGTQARLPPVLASKRAELGLDRPLVAQYTAWLSALVSGDAGASYTTGEPIGMEIWRRIGNSMVLMSCGLLVAIPVSLIVGVRAAARAGRRFDAVTNYSTLAVAAVPEFMIAAGLVAAFSAGGLGWLPAVTPARTDGRPWDDPAGMVLPVVAMALLAIPYLTRSVRASMTEVLDADFVLTARLNGVPERRVLWRYALPNTVGSTVQVVALALVYLVGGAVVIESVFNFPGVGTALVDAIATHDVPVVQLITLFTAVLYVVCNIVADVLTVLVTPRRRTAMR